VFHDGHWLWSHGTCDEFEPEILVECARCRQVSNTEAYVVDASNLSQDEMLLGMYEAWDAATKVDSSECRLTEWGGSYTQQR